MSILSRQNARIEALTKELHAHESIDDENAVATALMELGELERKRAECRQRYEGWRLAVGQHKDVAADRLLAGQKQGTELAEAEMKLAEEAANLEIHDRAVEKARRKLERARAEARARLAKKSEDLRNELVKVLAAKLLSAQEAEVELLKHEEWDRRVFGQADGLRASFSFHPIAPETPTHDSILAAWLRSVRLNGIEL